jgi:hypothetical protein
MLGAFSLKRNFRTRPMDHPKCPKSSDIGQRNQTYLGFYKSKGYEFLGDEAFWAQIMQQTKSYSNPRGRKH